MIWSCTELLRYGNGARLDGDAFPETSTATVHCESDSGTVIIEVPTEWEALPDAELLQRIELARTGADEDANEE
jgi:hypothetical protein